MKVKFNELELEQAKTAGGDIEALTNALERISSGDVSFTHGAFDGGILFDFYNFCTYSFKWQFLEDLKAGKEISLEPEKVTLYDIQDLINEGYDTHSDDIKEAKKNHIEKYGLEAATSQLKEIEAERS